MPLEPRFGPLVALVALGLIILICRWVFASPPRPAPPAAPGQDGYGLLEPVTVVRTRADADMLRAVLRDAGIRGTVTPSDDGFTVLVFRDDLSAARDLVRS